MLTRQWNSEIWQILREYPIRYHIAGHVNLMQIGDSNMVWRHEWTVCVCVCPDQGVFLSFQSWSGQVWVCVLVLVQCILYTIVVRMCMCVIVCSFNRIVQAESYLLFHKGSDFPPREKRHIRCHYRELSCLCRAREMNRSIYLPTLTSTYINIFFFSDSDKGKDLRGEDRVS